MKKQQPEKINIEKNPIGISFTKSKKIKNYFDKNNFLELGISVFFSIMIGFILMALFNIQQYIEDPFDQEGFDDLKFDEMVVGEQEVLD